MGRLVKKTPSRHYWLYDNAKWVRLGLNRIADLLKVSVDVIKAAIFATAKKADQTKTEKAVEGLKYWCYNVADKGDIAFLVFFAVMAVVLMVVTFSTHDVILIASCAVFDVLMAVYVGLLTVNGYKDVETF